ncbi:MAG: hypothetical protein Q7K11_01565 [Candidatus Berkelbacteria bacterium]|nr:hypothetical protein [Candidatus Berkelbacteria bacterium]
MEQEKTPEIKVSKEESIKAFKEAVKKSHEDFLKHMKADPGRKAKHFGFLKSKIEYLKGSINGTEEQLARINSLDADSEGNAWWNNERGGLRGNKEEWIRGAHESMIGLKKELTETENELEQFEQ